MIEDFLRAFEANLVGTPAEKAEWVAELAAHLEEAKDAGDLRGALTRLGSPRQAASEFRSGRPLVGAAFGRRLTAAFIDVIPLLIVVVASFVQHLVQHGGGSLVFPPFGGVDITGPGVHWSEIATPLAELWIVVGLGAIEARTGRTPGKALMGMRTVSQDGTPLSLEQALGRRLSILGGPLVYVDWLFATDQVRALLADHGIRIDPGRRQRLFDMIFHTMVIFDPTPAFHQRPSRHHLTA